MTNKIEHYAPSNNEIAAMHSHLCQMHSRTMSAPSLYRKSQRQRSLVKEIYKKYHKIAWSIAETIPPESHHWVALNNFFEMAFVYNDVDILNARDRDLKQKFKDYIQALETYLIVLGDLIERGFSCG